MALSNSSNYTLNGTELLTSAFEIIGVAQAGEPLEPEDSATGFVVLNLMLKALQNQLNIWKRKTLSIPLTLSKISYTIGQKSAGNATSLLADNLVDSGANFNTDDVVAGDTVKNITSGTSATVSTVTSTTTLTLDSDIFTIGTEAYEITSADVSAPRPMEILECNRKGTAGDEISMIAMTRNEYENLPNKTSAGAPINYHYDPTLGNGTFYIWQAPDASAVTDWTIELVYRATIEDIDEGTDDIDCPPENLEALVINLAYRLSSRFGGMTSSEKQILRADAADALALAVGFDQESGSVFFQPEMH
jgi:hypothetical protein